MSGYKVILNPAAGAGAGKRALPRIERLFQQYQLGYELTCTEAPWHAADLAREASLAGWDVIVSAGGDGTANEAINGLIQAQAAGGSAALGLLGVGRGNDFSHTVGIPTDLEAAVQTLAANRRRRIDIGRVVGDGAPQGRYFGNCVGVGFDAMAAIEAAKLPRWGGLISYLIAVLRTVFLYDRGPRVRLAMENQTFTQRTLMISIVNGPRLGGGFWIAPEADPQDGRFDLCLGEQVKRRRIFTLIPHFLRGTHITQREITMAQGAKFSIRALEGDLPAQVDGEILCVDGKRLEVEVVARQLEVIYQPTDVGT